MPHDTLSRYTVNDVGRVYYDDDGNYYLSVSTILDVKPTPAGLKQWKENNDDWREIRNYKQHRGTLIHYHCLNEFADEDMWSQDEASSENTLKQDSDDWDRYEEDCYWATNRAWPFIKRHCGITEDSVLRVENFVLNETVGYAGQFDLLYQDPETDETVLADIKTSKGVYDKHQIQSVAYMNAVDVTVDRVEILRMNPDYQEWEVSSSDEWDVDIVELWDEFLDLRKQIDDSKIEAILGDESGMEETER